MLRRYHHRCALGAVATYSNSIRHNSSSTDNNPGSAQEDVDPLQLEDELFDGSHSTVHTTSLSVQRQVASLRSELRRIEHVMFFKPQMGWSNPADAATDGKAQQQARKAGSPSLLVSSVLKPMYKAMNPSKKHLFAEAEKEQLRGGAGAGGSAIERVYKNKKEREEAKELRYKLFKRNQRLSKRWQLIMQPRRHPFWALLSVMSNTLCASRNAVYSLLLCPMAAHFRGESVPKGFLEGVTMASAYLGLGFVISPLMHMPTSLYNVTYGVRNFVSLQHMYDPLTGCYWPSNTATSRHLKDALEEEREFILRYGEESLAKKKADWEAQWKEHAESLFPNLMGNSAGGFGTGGGKKGAQQREQTYYETLNVDRNATGAQIKSSYQRLVKVYHPDVNTKDYKDDAAKKFHEINTAYKVLSNPEKRRQYDVGGQKAVSSDSTSGAILGGNPMKIIQKVFGGVVCEEKFTGTFYRSHWHMSAHARTSISLHELEMLFAIRSRLLAIELAEMVDAHAVPAMKNSNKANSAEEKKEVQQTAKQPPAKKAATPAASKRAPGAKKQQKEDFPFTSSKKKGGSSGSADGDKKEGPHKGGLLSTKLATLQSAPITFSKGAEFSNLHHLSPEFNARLTKFCRRIANECCFGEEVLYEVGSSYVTNAQAHLKVTHFLEPKKLASLKMTQGFGDIIRRTRKTMNAESKEDGLRMAASMYFHNEWDALVADLHPNLRVATAQVANDTSISPEQRRERLYAMWHLGNLMMKEGRDFGTRPKVHTDDNEFAMYVRRKALLDSNMETFGF